MAVTLKKTKKSDTATVSAAEVLKKFQKDMGEGVGTIGNHVVNTDRIPTGMFELDLALAGGFPKGKTCMIFGPESSNKTNIALMLIANHQRLWPDEVCIFVDVENEFNAPWAAKMGVDVEKLMVLKPAYAEQAVDMIETLLLADDTGIIVLDSIAAMTGTAEIEKSAEGENPGAAGRIASKLYRKTTVALSEAEKRGRYPTLIYINQITFKIGVMFGNPETTPGGKKPWYQSALVLRVYGTNVIDKSVSQVMPVRKDVSFVVKKFKIPILAASGKFEMATMDHGVLQIGQCDDAKTLRSYLEAFGEFGKADKGGWQIMGEVYATQQAWKARLFNDEAYGAQVRKHVVDHLMSDSDLIQEGGSVDGE